MQTPKHQNEYLVAGPPTIQVRRNAWTHDTIHTYVALAPLAQHLHSTRTALAALAPLAQHAHRSHCSHSTRTALAQHSHRTRTALAPHSHSTRTALKTRTTLTKHQTHSQGNIFKKCTQLTLKQITLHKSHNNANKHNAICLMPRDSISHHSPLLSFAMNLMSTARVVHCAPQTFH